MLKIGFVDHHLNNFHANKFLTLLHGPLADQGARVWMAWEGEPTGEDWCVTNDIPRAATPVQVAEECDAVIVLAPDNVEAHLGLCRLVFPVGKPCMVDKFLAPNVDEAGQILALADAHKVALFSASALRFAVELEAALPALAEPPAEAFARGMGEWGGYGVHTLSLVLGTLGPDVAGVIDTGTAHTASVTLAYADGRRAYLDVRAAENQWETLPWSFGFRTGTHYTTGAVQDYDGFYANLMRRAVEFFRTGVSPVSQEEMLTVVAILEAAERSRAAGGVWQPL